MLQQIHSQPLGFNLENVEKILKFSVFGYNEEEENYKQGMN